MIRKYLVLGSLVLVAAAPGFGQTNPAPRLSNPAPSSAVNVTNQASPLASKRPKVFRSEHYVGTLVKVDTTNLVISTRVSRTEVRQVSIAADSQADIRTNGAAARLEDLKPGMVLNVLRTGPPGSKAGRLRVIARDPELSGVVMKAGTTNVVLHVSQPGVAPHDVSVAIDAATKILMVTEGEGMPSKGAKLEDLKPGTEVNIVPPTGGTATRITITRVADTAPTE